MASGWDLWVWSESVELENAQCWAIEELSSVVWLMSSLNEANSHSVVHGFYTFNLIDHLFFAVRIAVMYAESSIKHLRFINCYFIHC